MHMEYSTPASFSDERKKMVCITMIERIDMVENEDVEIKWRLWDVYGVTQVFTWVILFGYNYRWSKDIVSW